MMNHQYLTLLVIFCSLFALGFAAPRRKERTSSTTSESDSGAARRDLVATKLLQTSVVPLTDGNFSKFITSRPREYSAVLMFTAINPKYQCQVCLRAQSAYNLAADYYRDQYDFKEVGVDKRFAFFVVDVETARGTFEDMKLETVPRFYVLPPRESDSPKLKMSEFEINSMTILEGPGSFLTELERLSGIKVGGRCCIRPNIRESVHRDCILDSI
jgi:hypothetical protein